MLTTEQFRCLQKLRSERYGRLIASDLKKEYLKAREVYETTPASEPQRLRVRAYKLLHKFLFSEPMEGL